MPTAMEPLQARDPRRIGEFALAGRLGQTPLGAVFLGRSAAGRPVRVTVLDDRWALDRQARARFTEDVAAARAVTGPRTVPLVEADPDAARPWLAWAQLPGRTLAEAVAADGPLSPGSLLPFARALAEGLAGLHTAGVVHRDLTPAQVVLGPDGPRLGGFGVAPPIDLDLATRAGGMPAITAYLAPEQVSGSPATPASDVFALGGVLYLAATGEAPFGIGPASATLGRIVRADVQLDRIPDGTLRELVAACLDVDPRRRPGAGDVARRAGAPAAPPLTATAAFPRAPETMAPAAGTATTALGATAAGLPPASPRPYAPLPVEPASSPPPAPAPGPVPAFPAALVGALPSAPPSPPGVAPLGSRDPLPGTLPAADAPAASRRPRSRRYLAIALAGAVLVASGALAWTRIAGREGAATGATAGAPVTTPPAAPPSTAPTTPGDGAAGTPGVPRPATTVGTARATLSGHTGFALAVAFDAAGTRIATAGADRTARIWDVAKAAPVRTLTMPTDNWVMAVAFSPDGRLLATGGLDGKARLWDLRTGAVVRTLPGHAGGVFAVAFSPNGKLVVTVGKDRVARLWNVATGKRTRVLSGHKAALTGVAFSPDGMLVATSSTDGTVRLWRPGTGRLVRTLASATAPASTPATAPASAQATAQASTPAGGTPLTAVAFSRDGGRVAAAGRDGTTRIWATASGAVTGRLSGSTNAVLAVAFGPQGQLVTAGEDNKARVWDVATGTATAVLTAHTSWVMGVAVSPDGGTLATASDDRTARLWALPAASGTPTPTGV